MPKLKTNKAVRKRFKITAGKKVLKNKSKRRHLLADKSSNMKRKLRGWSPVDKTLVKHITRALPYG